MAYLGRRGVGANRHRFGIWVSPKVTAIILFIIALFPIGIGIFLTCKHVETNKYYKPTEAVITTVDWYIDSSYTNDGGYVEKVKYFVDVDYEVDGKEYKNVALDYYQAGMKEGQKIIILYDTRDPSKILSSGGTTVGIWVAFGIAGICIILGIYRAVVAAKAKKKDVQIKPSAPKFDEKLN